MTPRRKDTETYFSVENSTGRRFHIDTDEEEAVEVATRLEAQLRGAVSAAAVGGATPTLADLPEYVVKRVIAPKREHVAEAIEQGVVPPGVGTPTGGSVTGNEVDERRAAELRARGDDPDVATAFGVEDAVRDSEVEDRTTQLEPRPQPQPERVTTGETVEGPDGEPVATASVRDEAPDESGLPEEGTPERDAANASGARSE